MPPSDKGQLRSRLRQRRRDLPPDTARTAAIEIAHLATTLPGWQRAANVGLYLPTDGEIDTEPLAERARDAGKSLFLPAIRDDRRLVFRQWRQDDPLPPNQFGIPEPPPTAPALGAVDIDILFLPMVGWDRRGARLGMGGGYYDRTLAQGRGAALVGLAYEAQEIDRLPTESWDIYLDYIITGGGLYRPERHSGKP